MKTRIAIFIAAISISTCFAQQDLLPAYPREITYRGDIAYFNGSPFTGLLVDEKTNKRLGVFKNGYRDGIFTEYHTNGKKKADGKYINGTKVETHTEWFDNGNKKSECKYLNGQKDGICTEWFVNGQIQSSVTYNNGAITDGNYVIYLENGQKETETTYKNGQIIMSGKYEGSKFIVLSEVSVELYSNGQKKSEGWLKYGKKEELWTFWYENGQKKSQGIYKDGNQDGQWVSWFKDGDKESEGNYNNGVKEGLWTVWYEGGQKKSEGYYKAGSQEGRWASWFADGKKEFEGSYVNGQKEGYCTLILSNRKKYQGECKNGELNGKGSWYIDHGDGYYVSYTGYFVNGKEEGQGTFTGVMKAIYGSSSFSFTGEWKGGEMFNGLYYTTDNLGKHVTEYRNGRIIQSGYVR